MNEFTKAYASALNRPALFPVPGFVFNTIFGEERANMVLESQVKINFKNKFRYCKITV